MKWVRWFLRPGPFGASLGVLLVAAIVAVSEAMKLGSPDLSRPGVFVARHDLGAGLPILFRDIAPQRRTESLPSDAVQESELHLLDGAVLTQPVPKGNLLRFSHFDYGPSLSEQIPGGYRAYSLKITTTLPLRVGDRVDITSVINDRVETLVEGARVLGFDPSESSGIIMAVTYSQVKILDAASRQGRLSLSLRNPLDVGVQAKKKATRKKRNIEVLMEAD